MPAGIRIWNDARTVQIDQNYINLALSAKGSVTMVDDGLPHPQPIISATVTVSGTNPVIAFRSTAAVNLERTTVSGRTWTFHFRAQSNSPATLRYWVFDNTANAIGYGTKNYGLRIAKFGSLTPVFDSATKPLRIVGVSTAPMPPAVPGPDDYEGPTLRTVAPPPGRVYAAIQGTMGYFHNHYDTGRYGTGEQPPGQILEEGPPPPNATWRHMKLETYHSTATTDPDGSITSGLTQFEDWSDWYPFSGTSPTAQSHGNLMTWVVDVTHY